MTNGPRPVRRPKVRQLGELILLTAALLTCATSTGWAQGEIVAWGWNDHGICDVPEPNSGFISIAAGGRHSLGLKADGSIVAWGDNWNLWGGYSGQCVVPSPNTDFTAVAAGSAHSLGLKADGSIVAWGANTDIFGNYRGQCVVPSPNSGFTAVAAGSDHSLGLKADGSIVAWEYNYWGQCNVPLPNTEFTGIAAGAYHSLGLKADGSIVAWGDNDFGQCNVPSPNTGFTGIAANVSHSLGLKADGSIVAWGANGSGQCDVPSPNTGFTAVAAGSGHSLGLKADGSIVAWGDNSAGQCDVPPPNAGFTAVAGKNAHVLGLKQVVEEPSLVLPANRAIYNRAGTSSIAFSWIPVSGALEYWLNVFEIGQAGMPKFSGSVSGTSQAVTVNNTWSPARYTWEVRARTSVGWGPYSSENSPREFVVDIPPSRPTLFAPSSAATCQVGTLQAFSWSPVMDAARYDYRLVPGTDLNAPPLVSVELIEANQSVDFSAINYSPGNYIWGVRAIKAPPPGYDEATYEATMGWGAYSMRQLTLQAASADPFAIVDVAADRRNYVNGVDTVNLAVEIRNNFGPTPAHIAVFIRSHIGQRQEITNTSVDLAPGTSASLPIAFLMPSPGWPAEYAVDVEYGTVSRTFASKFVGTEMTTEEITAAEEQVSTCLTPEESCAIGLVGLVPLFYIDTAADVVSVGNSICEYNVYMESGNYIGAGFSVLGGVFTGVSAVSEPLQIALPVLWLPGAVTTGFDCAEALISNWFDKAQSATAHTLMGAAQLAFDAMGADYVDEAIVYGPGTLLIECQGSVTSADSLQLSNSVVLRFANFGAEWAHVGSGAVPLGLPMASNPVNQVALKILGTTVGEIDFSLLHRDGGGVVSQLKYEPFRVTETTVCWLTLDDATEDFGIRIDYDGDGVVDHTHFAIGQVAGDDGLAPGSAGGPRLYGAFPNPFNPRTTIAYEAASGAPTRLAIYDMAGRLVRMLVDGRAVASGRQEAVWDGRDDDRRAVSAGIYLCRFDSGEYGETKRMVLIR